MRKTAAFTRNEIFSALCLFSLTYLRYLFFGFKYFYMLDDYIQYHNLRFFTGSLSKVVSSLGLLAARPLAGVSDYAIWSNFWGFMPLAVAILTAIFTTAAILFYKVFKRNFGISYIFFAFFLLIPANIEGAYWISASSRAVVGLFFAALCTFLFDKYISSGKLRFVFLSLLPGIIAAGYYEQGLVLSVAGPILLCIFNFKTLKVRALNGFYTLIIPIIYFGFTSRFESVMYSGRLDSFTMPFGNFYFTKLFPIMISELFTVFIKAPIVITAKGFIRFFQTPHNTLWLLALIALAALFYIFAKKSGDGDEKKKDAARGMVFGLLLALAGAAPFFFLGNPAFPLRAIICCLPGLALFVDRFFALIAPKKAAAGIAVAFAVLFMLASVSELSDYRETEKNDIAVASALVAQKSLLIGGPPVAIIGIEPIYLTRQNFFYHEHIHGVTESKWALGGALQFLSSDYFFPHILPLRTHGYFYFNEEEFLKCEKFFYLDTELILRELSYRDGAFYEGEELFATIEFDDIKGQVFVKENQKLYKKAVAGAES